MLWSMALLRKEQRSYIDGVTNAVEAATKEVEELRRDEDKNFYLLNQTIELESSRTRTYLKERINEANCASTNP